MPLYTYACRACEREIERRQGFHDAPLTECESCGGDLRRVLHPVGIVFKGSGFYNTDYRNGSGKPAGERASEKNGTEKNGSESSAARSENGTSSSTSAASASESSTSKASELAAAKKAS